MLNEGGCAHWRVGCVTGGLEKQKEVSIDDVEDGIRRGNIRCKGMSRKVQ